MTIGQKLKIARNTLQITQEEVAAALGERVSPVSVSHWENDKSVPSMANQLKLCRLYGIDHQETFGVPTEAQITIAEEEEIKIQIAIPKSFKQNISFSINVQQSAEQEPTFIYQAPIHQERRQA